MSDDALIRLSNLKSMDLTPTQLAERVGGRYTYWRDLLAGQKSFGEKIARKIEEALDLPRGHLDASESGMSLNPNGWPLQNLSYSQFLSLPSAFHEAVESFATAHAPPGATPTPKGNEEPQNVSRREKKGVIFVGHKLRTETERMHGAGDSVAEKARAKRASGKGDR